MSFGCFNLCALQRPPKIVIGRLIIWFCKRPTELSVLSSTFRVTNICWEQIYIEICINLLRGLSVSFHQVWETSTWVRWKSNKFIVSEQTVPLFSKHRKVGCLWHSLTNHCSKCKSFTPVQTFQKKNRLKKTKKQHSAVLSVNLTSGLNGIRFIKWRSLR